MAKDAATKAVFQKFLDKRAKLKLDAQIDHYGKLLLKCCREDKTKEVQLIIRGYPPDEIFNYCATEV